MSKQEGHEQMNVLSFQCSIWHFIRRPTYILLLLVTQICHRSIAVVHSTILYSWQWYVTQPYTHNALLCFHCNNGYANVLQCYIIHHCLFGISLIFLLEGTPGFNLCVVFLCAASECVRHSFTATSLLSWIFRHWLNHTGCLWHNLAASP
jgi:hypothetical protein